jgi:hypothetical protein
MIPLIFVETEVQFKISAASVVFYINFKIKILSFFGKQCFLGLRYFEIVAFNPLRL